MPSLEEDFEQLFKRLQDPGQLSAAQTDPIYYFVFRPEEALDVKRLMPIWVAKLQNAGMQVERVSFVDLLWELIDAKGRWRPGWRRSRMPTADRSTTRSAACSRRTTR